MAAAISEAKLGATNYFLNLVAPKFDAKISGEDILKIFCRRQTYRLKYHQKYPL